MQITVSKDKRLSATIRRALVLTNAMYKKNPIRLNDYVAKTDKKAQFTLRCSKSSKIVPARLSPAGNHTRAVSWQAHREFMRHLFDIDPNAKIFTVVQTYNGKGEFKALHPETYNHNLGSVMRPALLGELAVKKAA